MNALVVAAVIPELGNQVAFDEINVLDPVKSMLCWTVTACVEAFTQATLTLNGLRVTSGKYWRNPEVVESPVSVAVYERAVGIRGDTLQT